MTYKTGGILIENLRKVYGHGDTAVEALKNVNMQVSAGEVVGLVGPSGAGKSTLLKCLGAIIEPTSGRMTLGNEVIFEDGCANFELVDTCENIRELPVKSAVQIKIDNLKRELAELEKLV